MQAAFQDIRLRQAQAIIHPGQPDPELAAKTPKQHRQTGRAPGRNNVRDCLDGRARQVLALKFAGALTNRQIAVIHGLTESNVGVILYRALLKLRSLLIASMPTEARHDP